MPGTDGAVRWVGCGLNARQTAALRKGVDRTVLQIAVLLTGAVAEDRERPRRPAST
jgi:hypothetical protein